MEQRALFRKAALDKLASPERLDALMRVTSPKGWIALWTIAAVLVGIVLWSVFGSMPERIDGVGELIRGGGLRDIRASGDGVIVRLDLRINDVVQPDQLLGEVSGTDVTDRLVQAKTKVRDAERETGTASGEDEATIQGRRATIDGYREDIARHKVSLARAQEDRAVKQKAFEEGLIPKSRVDEILSQINILKSQIEGLNSDISGVEAQIRGIEQRIRGRKLQVNAARTEFVRVEHITKQVSTIKSTVVGRILSLNKRVGDRVRDGEVLATVEPTSAVLDPVVYVPSDSGKRIHPGMEVQVSPSTVKREEYGFMRGTVGSVGEYPATPETVSSTLGNSQQVKDVLASSKIELHVTLKPESRTVSGYEWSTYDGPPFKIEGGTQVSVAIVVDRRAPISKVLPLVRGAFGG